MKIFDTHTHYDDEAYDADRDELLTNLLSTSVAGFTAIGCSLERSRLAIALAEKYEQVVAAVGIHPEGVADLPDDYISRLRTLAAHEKVRALGEIGLDYHYPGYDKERQIRIFSEQLRLANELKLPVIIHSRDAMEDTLEIIERDLNVSNGAVMHCYSGGAETAKKLTDMGIMLSFTGVVTFRNARAAQEAAAVTPLSMLMLETDCPYLAPEPFRGKRCDSGMLGFIAEKIASVKQTDAAEIIKAGNENAARFYKLGFDL